MNIRAQWLAIPLLLIATGCRSKQNDVPATVSETAQDAAAIAVDSAKSTCSMLMTTSNAGSGLIVEVDASECQASERDFVFALKDKLSSIKPIEVRSMSIVGPGGEAGEAIIEAWAFACKSAHGLSKDAKSQDFAKAFANSNLGHAISRLFVNQGILFEIDSIDNFYPLKRKSVGVKQDNSCDAGLLPPVVWFKPIKPDAGLQSSP